MSDGFTNCEGIPMTITRLILLVMAVFLVVFAIRVRLTLFEYVNYELVLELTPYDPKVQLNAQLVRRKGVDRSTGPQE